MLREIFQKNLKSMQREFLVWFTPVSLIAVAVIIVSGLVSMKMIVPEYVNSWMLSYGQALLIKHLLLVPVIGLCLIQWHLCKEEVQERCHCDPVPLFMQREYHVDS